MPTELLRLYLQDHHAGSTMGLELARRAAKAQADEPWGAELAGVADEIEADRETLERVMGELGASASRIKDAGAWAGEKIGRLKPNDRIAARSPLSHVVELEGLVMGVTGKVALWEALAQSLGPSVGGFDLAALAASARAQLERLERMRLAAAELALRPDSTSR